jgi:hypothetical protein
MKKPPGGPGRTRRRVTDKVVEALNWISAADSDIAECRSKQ